MKKFLLIFFITFSVFFISGKGTRTTFDFFVPLADSFNHGRLYVDQMRFELHEMVPDEEVKTSIYTELVDGQIGKYYVIYPPLPAIILMPIVAIWGLATNQSLVSILIASLSVAISYLVFKEILKDERKTRYMVALYALGSMLWYHAVIGSSWYFAQVCALFLMWLAILATLRKQNLFLIGALIGLSYLCRFPVILSIPFYIIISWDRLVIKKRINHLNFLRLLAPIFISILISLIYNWVRYHHLGHYGYTLLELRPYNISNEYSEGSYSLSYITRNLSAIFTGFPIKIDGFPFWGINSHSMALWFVFPALFILFSTPFKKKLALASLCAILFILPVTLLHGGVGATQFGYRYALDFMPFILVLVTLAIKEKFYLWQKALIIISILINFWGIWVSFWLN